MGFILKRVLREVNARRSVRFKNVRDGMDKIRAGCDNRYDTTGWRYAARISHDVQRAGIVITVCVTR